MERDLFDAGPLADVTAEDGKRLLDLEEQLRARVVGHPSEGARLGKGEVLVAHTADDVVQHLLALDTERAKQIGQAAQTRVLAQHTYQHRALQLQELLSGASSLCNLCVLCVSVVVFPRKS